jgi:hypothetical protein
MMATAAIPPRSHQAMMSARLQVARASPGSLVTKCTTRLPEVVKAAPSSVTHPTRPERWVVAVLGNVGNASTKSGSSADVRPPLPRPRGAGVSPDLRRERASAATERGGWRPACAGRNGNLPASGRFRQGWNSCSNPLAEAACGWPATTTSGCRAADLAPRPRGWPGRG